MLSSKHLLSIRSDFINIPLVYRIFLLSTSFISIKLLNVHFNEETVNNYLLVFTSAGLFSILSFGIHDYIAFVTNDKGLNKSLVFLYTFITLFLTLIATLLKIKLLFILPFIFIYPLLTIEKILINRGFLYLAYTLQYVIPISFIIYFCVLYFYQLSETFIPIITLLLVLVIIYKYNRKTKWNSIKFNLLINSTFITENIQWVFLFGLDILLSAIYLSHLESNKYIIITKIFSIYQISLLIIQNNQFRIFNGELNYFEFKNKFFRPLFYTLLLFSISAYIFTPAIFKFLENKMDNTLSINTLLYFIIIFITITSSIIGAINSPFVKQNGDLFKFVVRKQFYLILLIVLIMLALIFNFINFITFLFLKSIFLLSLSLFIKRKLISIT